MLKQNKSLILVVCIGVLSLFSIGHADSIPGSYGEATHSTTSWQELAAYDSDGNVVSNYGVSWSVDSGATWGRDVQLFVGQEIQFKFDMHKQNVGTHYADFLKAWVDWGNTDGVFSEADVVAYEKELLSNDPDFTYFSDKHTLVTADIGDHWLRARVTCSESLMRSAANEFDNDNLVYKWDLQDDEPYLSLYEAAFKPDGWLNQGEVEEWKLTVNPVPEPATMLLFGAGLIGLAGVARRKKK